MFMPPSLHILYFLHKLTTTYLSVLDTTVEIGKDAVLILKIVIFIILLNKLVPVFLHRLTLIFVSPYTQRIIALK